VVSGSKGEGVSRVIPFYVPEGFRLPVKVQKIPSRTLAKVIEFRRRRSEEACLMVYVRKLISLGTLRGFFVMSGSSNDCALP
jgi:hypothetical protein